MRGADLGKLHPTEEGARVPRTWSSPRWLLILLGLGAAVHGWILAQQLAGAPFARVPMVDAEVYWDWAGVLAGGQWQGDTPFFSAPLYPYLLGVLRSLGAGLTAVYLLQLVMHLCTSALVWWVGRERFDGRTGLLAATLWLLAQGPAYANLRILAGPVQTLLVAATLAALTAYQTRPRAAVAGVAGLLAGLTALAWPPAQAMVLALALWMALHPGPTLKHALSFLFAGVLTISPATVHNWRASGEFIAITAHGGITLYHGNNPTADGTFSPHGVSDNKRVHERDAFDQAQAAAGGEEIGWSDVSSHFSARALDWWGDNPGQAFKLLLRKGWFFMTSSVHGEMYVPTLEKQDGSASRLYAAVLPECLLVLPALVAALLLLLRDPRRYFPEAAFVLLALGVCLAFFYSPRYRLPALPAMALLAAWMATELYEYLGKGRLRWSLAWPIAVGALCSFANPWLELEPTERYRADYELRVGSAHEQLGQVEEARRHWELARGHGHPQADLELARLRLETDPSAALAELQRLAEQRPGDGSTQCALGLALARAGQPAAALEYFRRAIGIDRNDVDAELGAGGCLVQLGEPERGLAHFERVLHLDPGAGDVNFNRGVAFERLAMVDEAQSAYEAELIRDGQHEQARGALVALLQRTGQHAQAVVHARAMLETEPEHVGAQLVLAWLLATSRDASLRNGPEAVRVARALVQQAGEDDPVLLDTLAASLACAGEWEEAQRTQQLALSKLPAEVDANLRSSMQARLELYSQREPYQEGP